MRPASKGMPARACLAAVAVGCGALGTGSVPDPTPPTQDHRCRPNALSAAQAGQEIALPEPCGWRWLSVSHIATLGLVSLIVVAKYAGAGNTAGVGSTDLGLKVSRAKAQHDRT